MKRLTWTPRAANDLIRLRRHLASENTEAAKRAVIAIRMGVKILKANPKIGRPVEEAEMNYREWLIPFGAGMYIVLYRVAAAEVVLLAIRHGREAGY